MFKSVESQNDEESFFDNVNFVFDYKIRYFSLYIFLFEVFGLNHSCSDLSYQHRLVPVRNDLKTSKMSC